MWAGPREVSMIHQLADGFFHSTKASLGAQNILARCVPTDQPVLFTLSVCLMGISDGKEAGGGWPGGKGGGGGGGGRSGSECAGSGSVRRE